MNPFINPNKRGIELPKGYKNLADILQAKKCEFCDDVAVETEGWPDDYRWCDACQRDLAEFTMSDLLKYPPPFGTSDKFAMSRYEAEWDRREVDFMRQKVKERKPQ